MPRRSIGKTNGLSDIRLIFFLTENDIRLIITTDIGKNTIVATVIKRKRKYG
jgi:hypothetical protein